MNDAAEAEGIPILACGVLRDTTGQVLLVHIGHDASSAPMWWLPGAHVPPARSATETLRAFLTADLGIHRPCIRGQHVISCNPSPAEPAGQLLILFDCATIDPRQLDRRLLRPDAFVHDACWAAIEHARTLLPRVEFLALTFALTHRPAGLYRHLPTTPAGSAAVLPGPPPRGNRLPDNTTVPPGTSHLMPAVLPVRTPPPALPAGNRALPARPRRPANTVDRSTGSAPAPRNDRIPMRRPTPAAATPAHPRPRNPVSSGIDRATRPHTSPPDTHASDLPHLQSAAKTHPRRPPAPVFSLTGTSSTALHFPSYLPTAPRTPAAALTGHALRQIRADHDSSLREFARRFTLNPGELLAWETGTRVQPLARIAWLLGALDTDLTVAARILGHAAHAGYPHLITDHLDHATAAQCYDTIASHITHWAPARLPDLLRTPEHDQLLSGYPLLDADQAEHQRQMLLQRHRALTAPGTGAHHTFFLGDTALHVCPAPARARQLDLLEALSGHPDITIHIVPAERYPPDLLSPFTLYHLDGTAIAVALHHQHAGTYTAARDILAGCAATTTWLAANALDPADTVAALGHPALHPPPPGPPSDDAHGQGSSRWGDSRPASAGPPDDVACHDPGPSMPPGIDRQTTGRPIRTPAAVGVGLQLRRAREARGLGLRAFARTLGIPVSHLWSLELTHALAEPVPTAFMLGALGADHATTRRIITQAQHSAVPEFVDTDPRNHAAVAWYYEHLADRVTVWAPTLIPDLLRTADHDLALITHPLADTDLDDARAEALPQRRTDLTDPRRHYTFLVGEAALDTCPPSQRQDQLTHLQSLAQARNITIWIVPATQCPPGMIAPFTLYQSAKRPIAMASHHRGASTYITDPATLDRTRQLARQLSKLSTSTSTSTSTTTGALDRSGPPARNPGADQTPPPGPDPHHPRPDPVPSDSAAQHRVPDPPGAPDSASAASTMPDAAPGELLLGDHIRRLRTERKVSRPQLATAAGIPASRIEKLERQTGRWTSLSDTAAVADALATPRADLAVALLHDYQIHYNQPPKRLYDMLVTPIDALETQPFGEWIRSEREARGLTLTDLRYLSLLPQDTIREIENNDLPDFVAPIIALADAFSMSRPALIIAAVASVPPRPHLDQPPETADRSRRVVPGDAAGAQEPDAQSTVDLECSEVPMTRGDAAYLRLRYETGATLEELAADTGHSYRCVHETLLAAGVTLRPARRRVPPCPPGMVATYENGASIRQVAQRYGLSYNRARNMLLYAGVTLRPQGRARKGIR